MATDAAIVGKTVPSGQIACLACRHQIGVGFVGLTPAEAAFMHRFKLGHDSVSAGGWIGGPDNVQPLLFTLYSGLALKCRMGEGDSNKPTAILLPGSFVGMETVTSGVRLRVRALTDITICRFDPGRWRDLVAIPDIAERLCRLEAMARTEAEDRLLAAGRSATSSLCHLLLQLYDGLARRRLVRDCSFGLPIPLGLIAELLRLTPVHLRRILHKLADEGVVRIADHRVHVEDERRLRALAGPASASGPAPLI